MRHGVLGTSKFSSFYGSDASSHNKKGIVHMHPNSGKAQPPIFLEHIVLIDGNNNWHMCVTHLGTDNNLALVFENRHMFRTCSTAAESHPFLELFV
jgi:hypothetical protein